MAAAVVFDRDGVLKELVLDMDSSVSETYGDQ